MEGWQSGLMRTVGNGVCCKVPGVRISHLPNLYYYDSAMYYKKNDIVQLTWSEFEQYANQIQREIQAYCKKNKLQIDIVVPILRWWGILAIKLVVALKIIRMLPYQYKYIHSWRRTKLQKMYNSQITNLVNFRKKNPVILVVEGNHSTGTIAKTVVADIKRQCPGAKMLYVSLAKDYSYKDSVEWVVFSTCGYYTNENRKLSPAECKKLGIEHNKVYIFPWETYEEELAMLNDTTFGYCL